MAEQAQIWPEHNFPINSPTSIFRADNHRSSHHKNSVGKPHQKNVILCDSQSALQSLLNSSPQCSNQIWNSSGYHHTVILQGMKLLTNSPRKEQNRNKVSPKCPSTKQRPSSKENSHETGNPQTTTDTKKKSYAPAFQIKTQCAGSKQGTAS